MYNRNESEAIYLIYNTVLISTIVKKKPKKPSPVTLNLLWFYFLTSVVHLRLFTYFLPVFPSGT